MCVSPFVAVIQAIKPDQANRRVTLADVIIQVSPLLSPVLRIRSARDGR